MIILTYDVGTTGVKTCLFSLGDECSREGASIQLFDSSFADYSLRILPNGGAEQEMIIPKLIQFNDCKRAAA